MTVAQAERVDVTTANQVLAFFAQNATRNWGQAVKSVVPEDLLEQTLVKINEAVGLSDRNTPVGTFVGSTAAARDAIDSDNLQEAIRLLKDEFRIFQVGRGRGNAVVVLDDTPLEGGSEPAPQPTIPEPTPATIAPPKQTTSSLSDPDALIALKLAMDERTALQHEADELALRLESNQARISELYQALGESLITQ